MFDFSKNYGILYVGVKQGVFLPFDKALLHSELSIKLAGSGYFG